MSTIGVSGGSGGIVITGEVYDAQFFPTQAEFNEFMHDLSSKCSKSTFDAEEVVVALRDYCSDDVYWTIGDAGYEGDFDYSIDCPDGVEIR